MAFFDRPVSAVAQDVAAGTVTARSLVEKSLAAITEKNSDLNIFNTVNADAALRRADELDSRSAEEKKDMPLCGIPVALKDNICTEGLRTTCSSRMLDTFVPPYDAHVTEQLTAAGAVIVGKTSMDEFAMGSSNENSYYGAVKNPVNPDCVPGGSSGGSAAAVAADMVPLALGSDTGGSIRQPASHCGVVGMKPTYGLVSRYGLVAFASSLDQIGPLAARVDDASLLLSVISGEDRRDSTNSGRSYVHSPEGMKDLSGVRIGLPREYFSDDLSAGVREKIDAVRKKMADAGAEIVDVHLPTVAHAIAAYYVIATAEASSNLARFDGVKYGHRTEENVQSLAQMYAKTRSEGFGAEVKRRILLGTYVLSSGYYDAYYLKAAKVRTLITQDFEKAFQSCDLILSPVTPAPAFKIGEKISDPVEMYLTDIYTVSANLAGIPGISVPAGTVDGLPVGAQLMAPDWAETTLCHAAGLIHDRA
ncbi:MAG: Asp-tRNA(Asn)/Glu-tRNA(Gln) amidotransferase subunit GatA [Fibrobacterota bacterium]